MTRSPRLLSHSFSRWKATQWKPTPLPPLPEVSVCLEGETGSDSQASVSDQSESNPDHPKALTSGSGSYDQLQLWLVLVTLGVSLVIALCVAFVYSVGVAANYLLGALVGLVYLRMLSRGVAELGKSRNRLGVTRLALFVGLIVLATQVESLQVLPIFLGFITYKVTLLIHIVQTLTRSSSSV
ncbi:MAG: ATP synthase subunit I [Thermostichus sp. BF3_bins_97]